jgi:hypothetical protein
MASLPIIEAILRGVSPMSFSASAAAPYRGGVGGGEREREREREGGREGGRKEVREGGGGGRKRD